MFSQEFIKGKLSQEIAKLVGVGDASESDTEYSADSEDDAEEEFTCRHHHEMHMTDAM